MKVFLVNPPMLDGGYQIREGRCMVSKEMWAAMWPPISLVTCAAVLRDEDINVEVLDCAASNVNYKKLSKIIRHQQPDLIIMSSATPSIVNDLLIVDAFKKTFKNIKVGIIGIHGTVLPNDCFDISDELDFIIRGEPEFTLKELAITLRDCGSLSRVKGLSYRDNSNVWHNEDRGYIEDLNMLPYPAWDLIDKSFYRLPPLHKVYLLVEGARGCFNGCDFCNASAYYGNNIRVRSPARIVEELAYFCESYSIYDFLFWAESFTVLKDHIVAVAKLIIKRKMNIRWMCNSRVDTVDFELLKIMKESGCCLICYGIESSSQRVLNIMKKNTTIQQARYAIEITKRAGIMAAANFIIGYPGERVDEINETIQFSKSLNLDFAQFYYATPYPGTKIFERIKNNFTWDEKWHKVRQEYPLIAELGLTQTDTWRLRRKAYMEFYLRPHIIFNLFKYLRIDNFNLFFKNCLMYLKNFKIISRA